MVSKKIIINASAAKYGGAKTIVESFVDWIGEADPLTEFFLLAPQKPANLPNNVQYIEKQTSGLATLLFSCIGVLWFCLKHRASHCISFNNVNLLLPVCRRITYFHQAKVFTETSVRFRLIAFAIHMLKGSTIVVQSPLIQRRFIQKFSNKYKFLVKWPGVKPEDKSNSALSMPPIKKDECVILWPVTDPNVWQKNLAWFKQNQSWLESNKIKLVVTSENTANLPNSLALGQISRADLFGLYQKVDGVLIVSIEETLCLPIFEAASLGANVMVLKMPYIDAIKEWRGLPNNVQLFTNPEELNLSPKIASSLRATTENYFKPDWLIY